MTAVLRPLDNTMRILKELLKEKRAMSPGLRGMPAPKAVPKAAPKPAPKPAAKQAPPKGQQAPAQTAPPPQPAPAQPAPAQPAPQQASSPTQQTPPPAQQQRQQEQFMSEEQAEKMKEVRELEEEQQEQAKKNQQEMQKLDQKSEQKIQKTTEKIQKTGWFWWIVLDVLDPLVGLIPVAGDIIMIILNSIPIVMLVMRSVKELGPGATFGTTIKYGLFMFLLVAVDAAIGFVPGVGDIADIFPCNIINRYIYHAGLKHIANQKQAKMEEDKEGKEKDLAKKGASAMDKLKSKKEKAEKKMRAGAPGGGGNMGFARNVMGGGDGEKKPPIIAIILITLALIAGGLLYQSFQGSDATQETQMRALIPVIMFVAGIVAVKFIPGPIPKIIGWIVLVLSFYGLLVMTAPHLYAAVVSGELMHSTERSAAAAEEQSTGILQQAMDTYHRSIAEATGQRLEGDVDETIKEEVGIKLLDPYYPNPDAINEDQLEFLEIAAQAQGFDPKTPLIAIPVCHAQTSQAHRERQRETATASIRLNTNPGHQQPMIPDRAIEGMNFFEDLTCYPDLQGCGDYVVTLSVRADHLRTDCQMRNHLIDKDVLKQKLTAYFKSYDERPRSQEEQYAAVNQMYGQELGSYRSLSQKGAIKVLMATQPVALIGVDSTTFLNFRSGIENAMDGWVTNVTYVNVTISPPHFVPVTSACRGWDWNQQTSTLALSSQYLRTANFRELNRGDQRIFPSCRLEPNGHADLTDITEVNFLAAVDYDYIVQKEHNLQVRNETGGVCREEGSVGSSTTLST